MYIVFYLHRGLVGLVVRAGRGTVDLGRLLRKLLHHDTSNRFVCLKLV